MTCDRPHLETCPACLKREVAPGVIDRTPDIGHPHGCEALYRCESCGHTWPTSWWCEP